MTNVYFPTSKTADEWRAMAKGRKQDAADSFDRSDTDGFVSQWASGVNARLYDLLADLADNGGIEELDWIFDAATDQPIENWKWISTRYGSSILIPGAEYGDGRFFNPSNAKKGADRLKRDKAKGFYWGVVKTEVVAMLAGSGKGMAGALSVRPIVERKKGSPLEVIPGPSDRYDREF